MFGGCLTTDGHHVLSSRVVCGVLNEQIESMHHFLPLWKKKTAWICIKLNHCSGQILKRERGVFLRL